MNLPAKYLGFSCICSIIAYSFLQQKHGKSNGIYTKYSSIQGKQCNHFWPEMVRLVLKGQNTSVITFCPGRVHNKQQPIHLITNNSQYMDIKSHTPIGYSLGVVGHKIIYPRRDSISHKDKIMMLTKNLHLIRF